MFEDYIDPLETLSDLLKKVRSKAGVSVKEMSRRVGVSYETLRGWEGYSYSDLKIPTKDRLPVLAKCYSLPLAEVELAWETAWTAWDNMKQARKSISKPRPSGSTGLSGGVCRKSILRSSESRVYGSRLR